MPFAPDAPGAFDPFGLSGYGGSESAGPMTEVSEDLLFYTEKGDICLRLVECWPQLLADSAILGSVLLLSRTEQAVLASRVNRTDFWPANPGQASSAAAVPSALNEGRGGGGGGGAMRKKRGVAATGNVMVELGSGFSVDLDDLHFVVAADERLEHERMLALQFFDKFGDGMFKAILTDGADREWFTHYILHYSRGGPPPMVSAGIRPPLPPPGALASDPAGITWLRQMWPHLNPAVPGDFIAGWEDMTRLEALEHVGAPFARPARYESLVEALLLASGAHIPLRFTLFNQGLHHEVTMVPRRMERCGDSIHLMDRDSEAHFLRAPGLTLWQTLHRQDHGVCIELYGSDRRRCCHIQCAGDPRDIQRWSDVFLRGDV